MSPCTRTSCALTRAACLAAVLGLCSAQVTAAQESLKLVDVTSESGVRFLHYDGSSGRRYIIETISAGLATWDYDQDGDLDLYFLNGADLPGAVSPTPARNTLYRNDGNWQFTDVTAQAGVGDTGYGLGVAVGDYDSDGDGDLYLNNFGRNVAYRNNGDGTFTDVAAETGTAGGDDVGAGAVFFDADWDGDLDLYVANYVVFDDWQSKPTYWQGIAVYPAPELFPAAADVYYLNNGDGTFSESTRAAGLDVEPGRGMGLIAVDYDDDGDSDLYVANDSTRDFLFENDGRGRFREVGLLAGIAYNKGGDALASMGVAAGDYDADGRFDFYVTTYQRQLSTLYRNLGQGLFTDVTEVTGAGSGTYPHVTWGVEFADLDLDQDLDLFMAAGHLMDTVDQFDDTTSYELPNILLRNDGRGRFQQVPATAASGLAMRRSSRGAAFDDLDADGDVDVVVQNARREPTLLRNETSGNHWLQLDLRGRAANRDAVGARVRLTVSGRTQIAEVHSGRGYQSHYGTRLTFGLGQATQAERLEIRWPGGEVQVMEDLAADQRLMIVQPASP